MVDKEEYSWLYDDMDKLKEKINFRDRIEYRINGKIHNSKGPAIILRYDPLLLTTPDEESVNNYYINGNKLSFDDWKIYNRECKLKKIKKKIKNKKELN